MTRPGCSRPLANGPLMARPAGKRRVVRKLLETVPLSWAYTVERVTRIELALSAWEADVLPLNYTRAEGHEDTGPRCEPVARPDIVPESAGWADCPQGI
jgi:hypothetical protein